MTQNQLEEPEQAAEVNRDVAREAAAVLGQKMSRKVRIQRWPGPLGPVLGSPLLIVDLDRAAKALAMSGFMESWVVEKIKEHLLAGGVFTNRGSTLREDELPIVSNGQGVAMQVRSEYRIATEQEVLDYVDTEQFANVTGHRVSKRAQETLYLLHYHEGPEIIRHYDSLPRQARVILDLLNDAGREKYSEASIEVVLSENVEKLKTKQDPSRIFGFYRRNLIEGGHLEEIND